MPRSINAAFGFVRRNHGADIPVLYQADTRAGGADVPNKRFMARTVQNADQQIACFCAFGPGDLLEHVLDRRIQIDLVPKVAKEKALKTVLSNSFGFGGTNASLILRAVS